MIEAYPLCWPAGYPRSTQQKYSRFKTTLAHARDFVKEEVRRLGATDLIISSNVPTRKDGELHGDWQRFKVKDHGAAVYFTLNGKQVCLCCDTYERIYDNLRAIGRTIEALRQIDRDGVSDFLNRAFAGFTAIPERTGKPSCWDVLGMEPTKDEAAITKRYKELAKAAHPDAGGSDEAFTALAKAYKEALNNCK